MHLLTTGFLKAAIGLTLSLGLFISPAFAHEGQGDHHHKNDNSHAHMWQEVDKPFQLQNYITSATAEGVQMPHLRLPELPGDARPWTKTDLKNDPMNFQFAIVSDRSGGIRPGVFENAVQKLNLLQPEFVMSVGDLIQGYSKDEKLLNWEWEDFGKMVKSLEMPFFYVPGNHDMSNATQRAKWHELHGPNYYHFLYGDVLFLCLDTEDSDTKDSNPVGLSEQQLAYFTQVLKENPSPRWTLVFMHRPLWVYGENPIPKKEPKKKASPPDPSRWSEFESLLANRKYTVFAGHVHSYTKYVRNDNKYFVLATTGGGSALRGIPNYGQFDHITWITMKDDGPVIANLLLSGILDEDVRTSEVAALVHGPSIKAETILSDPLPFTKAPLKINVRNAADVPLEVTITAPESAVKFKPASATVTIPAHGKEAVAFELNGKAADTEKAIDGLSMQWKGTYKTPNRGNIYLDGQVPLLFDQNRQVPPVTEVPIIDGDLTDWKDKLSSPQQYRTILGGKHAWRGPADSTLQWGTQFDSDFVYIAAKITDDSLLTASLDQGFKQADRIDVYLRGQDDANTPATGDDLIVHVKAAPGDVATSGIITTNQDVLAACRAVKNGYVLEMAVPVHLLGGENGQEWKAFQLNARVLDRDKTGPQSAELWWRPDWSGAQGARNSGLFIRSGD